MTAIFRSLFETPIGGLHVAVDGDGVLVEILLPNRRPATVSAAASTSAASGTLRAVERQLREYFEGKRRTFDVPMRAEGSRFERDVWERLSRIPFGTTTSYGAIASAMGLLNGARAVGRANGANPIPIIVPCHRVIGSDGRLTGYGGGLPLKRVLLEMEGALEPPAPRLF